MAAGRPTPLRSTAEGRLFCKVGLYNVDFRNVDVLNVKCQNIDLPKFTVRAWVRSWVQG